MQRDPKIKGFQVWDHCQVEEGGETVECGPSGKGRDIYSKGGFDVERGIRRDVTVGCVPGARSERDG